MLVNKNAYTRDDRLADLIADNSRLLMAISRFGITLGMANKTIAEISQLTEVDADTFLCVANMVSGKVYDTSNVRLDTLTKYLKRAHRYFLDFFLPSIRRKFIVAVDFAAAGDMAQLILRFYDEYVAEVRQHMDYEDKTLFAYIDDILANQPVDESYTISSFAEHHDAVAEKLVRLKDVMIRYCPAGDTDIINSVLFDIISCEDDLVSHCDVEDKILIPTVRRAEASAVRVARGQTIASSADAAPVQLGKREKEIVRCIALGLSNKEIADKLCISINTVTTHRRNISAKLDIHSPAGMTIYAIVNGLIDTKDAV